MRVVIDTNVIISALFFGRLPDELLELALNRKIKAVASAEIITEYENTDKELARKAKRRTINKALANILEPFEIIITKSKIDVCRDPDDNKFIACAIDGKCKYIVSGDNDLLDIKSFNNIEVVTVREFLNEYRGNRAK